LDGWPDILVVNGHIDPDIQKVQANVKFAEPPHLFRNLGKGKFGGSDEECGSGVCDGTRGAICGVCGCLRQWAVGHFDVTMAAGFVVSRMSGGPANHSLRVKLVGTKSNRDGIGAVVRVTTAEAHAGTDVAERIELFVGERAGTDVWRGTADKSEQCGDSLAERASG